MGAMLLLYCPVCERRCYHTLVGGAVFMCERCGILRSRVKRDT